MRVLVIGGTLFIGRNLVEALLKAGQKAFGDAFSAELANSMFPAPDRR